MVAMSRDAMVVMSGSLLFQAAAGECLGRAESVICLQQPFSIIHPPPAQVASAEVYEGVLKAASISLEQGARRSAIWAEVTAAAAKMGGAVPESAADDLLAEVCCICVLCVVCCLCECNHICVHECDFIAEDSPSSFLELPTTPIFTPDTPL